MNINHIITERFINLIGDDPKKEQYKDQVYAMLQKAYADIGGLSGSGFESPEDMVENIPFWKLVTKDGKLIAVIMYKDKGGRKAVATANDGSREAMLKTKEIVGQEDKRSYVEKSKKALGFYIKAVGGIENAKEYMIQPEKAGKLLGKEVIPVKSLDRADWPVDDEEREWTEGTLAKYPELEEYGYFRKIGGHYHFKIMSGTPNLPIK